MVATRRSARDRRYRERLFLAAFLGLSCGSGLGILMSQYLPMFGGIIAAIAPPFSLARIYTIVPHVLVVAPATAVAAVFATMLLGPRR